MTVGCKTAAAALPLVLVVGETVGLVAMLAGLGVRLAEIAEGDGAPTERGLGMP
jgi:hypothetical protein